MALTFGFTPRRRGAPPSSGNFGYLIAPNEQIFKGGLIGLNSSGYLQRIQTAGCVAFAGIADRDFDNRENSNPGPLQNVGGASGYAVIAEVGTYCLPVTGATFADVKGTVYASDDNTLTMTNSGSLLAVGTLAGFESGQTYVKLLGA